MRRLLEACNWRGDFTALPDMFHPRLLPQWFLHAVRDWADKMAGFACDVIERNIRTEGRLTCV